MATPSAIVFSPDAVAPPDVIDRWLNTLGAPRLELRDTEALMAAALRGRPRVVVFDSRSAPLKSFEALRLLKSDSYTAVVPALVLSRADAAAIDAGFEAGADEVVREGLDEAEAYVRLNAMLRRSDRDLHVHPSTRLPGAVEIEAEINRRMHDGGYFAACYADLDHFKEFNDRYSYYEGDRVIRMLARVLHDVVKGMCGTAGFVGHIGGDDFLFIIPLDGVTEVCEEIVSIFDALVPYQYSEQDRRAGYYFGKDRRGQLHRVPLMTVSIGIVTNEKRRFAHAAQVSALATEMKSYAKTLPGSVFSIDRRTDAPPGAEAGSEPLSASTARSVLQTEGEGEPE